MANLGKHLHSYHKRTLVLDGSIATHFILWLACGHSGGKERAWTSVTMRKCASCGGFKAVERVEPIRG